MSPEEGLQKSGKEFAEYPWYYRDVPAGIIVALVVLAVITTLAVEFRPIRTASPFTVVSHGDAPPPWKAPLPNQLPIPLLPSVPPPPVIPPPTVGHAAVDAILPKGVSEPEPPKAQAGKGKRP